MLFQTWPAINAVTVLGYLVWTGAALSRLSRRNVRLYVSSLGKRWRFSPFSCFPPTLQIASYLGSVWSLLFHHKRNSENRIKQNKERGNQMERTWDEAKQNKLLIHSHLPLLGWLSCSNLAALLSGSAGKQFQPLFPVCVLVFLISGRTRSAAMMLWWSNDAKCTPCEHPNTPPSTNYSIISACQQKGEQRIWHASFSFLYYFGGKKSFDTSCCCFWLST